MYMYVCSHVRENMSSHTCVCRGLELCVCVGGVSCQTQVLGIELWASGGAGGALAPEISLKSMFYN